MHKHQRVCHRTDDRNAIKLIGIRVRCTGNAARYSSHRLHLMRRYPAHGAWRVPEPGGHRPPARPATSGSQSSSSRRGYSAPSLLSQDLQKGSLCAVPSAGGWARIAFRNAFSVHGGALWKRFSVFIYLVFSSSHLLVSQNKGSHQFLQSKFDLILSM